MISLRNPYLTRLGRSFGQARSDLGFPGKFFLAQSVWIVFLFFAHLVSQSYNVLAGKDIEFGGSMQILNLDNESNLPAWYSSSGLFLCAILLGLIAYGRWNTRNKWRYGWGGLSVLFAFLSLDESASLHEEVFPGIMRRLTGMSDAMPFDWTPFGMLLCLVVVVVYLRFWLHLPAKIRWLFASAFLVFVLGAIGFEKVSHFYEAKYQTESTIAYVLTCGIEELLEMWGAAILTYALLLYLFKHVGFVKAHR